MEVSTLRILSRQVRTAASCTTSRITTKQPCITSGGEAQLDVQYAGGLSYPVQNTYFTTAGRPPFNPSAGTTENNSEPYLEFLQYLLLQKNPPQTISTSYGDEEQTVPIEYAKRVCGMFAQLGARGVTFLFSSGDSGVGDGDSVSQAMSSVYASRANRFKFGLFTVYKLN